MEHINKLRFAGPRKPPTIEFDLNVGAWYIRFRNARIAKTISEDKPGYIAAVDLDASNQVVGLELIGVREFSLAWLRKVAPYRLDLSRVDWERARFVRATPKSYAEV
jgi:hypothetical protein